jgi:threonine dehydratase
MNNTKTIFELVKKADSRIRQHISPSPLVLSKASNANNIYLKLENQNPTGSFKIRGSLNKVMALAEYGKAINVITASTGNHGMGVANALQITGGNGTIYLPKTAVKAKVDKLKKYNVNLEFFGEDSLKAEVYARAQAAEQGLDWISPYNDPEIIAGQGTIGIELLKDLEHIDKVFITVGGGGLLSGIASYLKNVKPTIKIIACQPVNSPEMYKSIEKGKIIDEDGFPLTLSDGSAGGLEPDAITFPICQEVIDDFILINETDIARAIKHAWDLDQQKIEGAAGVALAACLQYQDKCEHENHVVIICGGNIVDEVWEGIIN